MTIKNDGDGSLFISEQAAAKADEAGHGQLWVKSDTPNILMFTDDAGNDREVLSSFTTEIATTSGSSIDITNIPTSVRQIILMASQVSLSGTNDLLVQLGTSSTPETSGYTGGAVALVNAGLVADNNSSGFIIDNDGAAAHVQSGHCILTKMASDNNKWIQSGTTADATPSSDMVVSVGEKTLAAALDMIRLLPSASDTFDGGSINLQLFY